MADRSIPVIDLFSGPGGLSEGFSRYGERDWSRELAKPSGHRMPRAEPAFESSNRFRIALSIEKDPGAHRTLKLRAFFRQFEKAPADYYAHLRGEITYEELMRRHPEAARDAEQEAWCNALGAGGAPAEEVDRRIRDARRGAAQWVLIGGPPCQAYSLVGRSRRMGIVGYKPEKDDRHFLYREYLRIVAKHEPPVFVMENVKGLLSSKVGGVGMMDAILADMSHPGNGSSKLRYKLFPLAPATANGLYDQHSPRDYLIRMEHHGIPQARHRVILLGIREDLAKRSPLKLLDRAMVTLAEVIDDLPILRGGITRQDDDGPKVVDSVAEWQSALRAAQDSKWMRQLARRDEGLQIAAEVEAVLSKLRTRVTRGSEFIEGATAPDYAPGWYGDSRIEGVCNHAARAHLASDLHRYLFAACFASVHVATPHLRDFPSALLPNHESADRAVEEGGHFGDRFRVQPWNLPATTITSHIRKDGHYYIHPDPGQCRSFTVREAARVQTFPDNYLFCGNRTDQYLQVGNAVPPLLAVQIAGVVAEFLDRSGRAR